MAQIRIQKQVQKQSQVWKLSQERIERDGKNQGDNILKDSNNEDLTNDVDSDVNDFGDTGSNYNSYEKSGDPITNENLKKIDCEPIIDLKNMLALYVTQEDGLCNCIYEPTDNLRSELKKSNVEWGKKRNLFMTQLGKWFKEEQQAFLLDPEKSNLGGPIAQKDFIKLFKRENGKIIVDETLFSKFKGTICLIWHDKIMPLDYIFS